MSGVHSWENAAKGDRESLSGWGLSSSVSWNPLIDDKCSQKILLDMHYLGQEYRSSGLL